MQEKFGEIITLIAQNRNIEESSVKDILKEILLNNAAKKYGHRNDLMIEFDETGSFIIYINREVVEDHLAKSFFTISLTSALKRNSSAKLGDLIKEVLPMILDGSKKNDLIKELQFQLKKHQKTKEFDTFYDKIGTILMGCVKNIDATEAIISFTDHIGEVGLGSLKMNKKLKTDSIKYNNYIKVYVEDINKFFEPQIILSRTNPNFLKELLKSEIPEIADGLIEIKSIARDPGSLAKVAIYTNRLSLNPIKVCIGDRGARIHNVIKELSGEKINFVIWDENINQFIANALAPANVMKVIETKNGRFDVVVPDDDFSKAMGRGAQNVQLAKRLCGVRSITLLTEETEQQKYKELAEKQFKSLVKNLEIEEMMAHLLISENFDSTEIIANSTTEDIASLNGFDEELADLLIERAKTYLIEEKKQAKLQLIQQNKDITLFEINELTLEQITSLIENNIHSLKDLALKDAYELSEIFDKIGITMEIDLASIIILEARKKSHLVKYK